MWRTILNNTTEDVSWEFEAPAALSWSGIRKGRIQAMGFFTGIAAEHENPVLQITDYFSTDDAVAAFGRYDATVKATGKRVSTPVGHYFRFRDGKVSRSSISPTQAPFWRRRRSSATRWFCVWPAEEKGGDPGGSPPGE